MTTEFDITNLPNEIQEKLHAYERIRDTQRKYSKAYIARVSNTDEYRLKQRDYYYANQDKKQGRNNWHKYYKQTGKAKKAEYYDINRETLNFKQSYRYYMKNKTIEAFKTKFPERYDKLLKIGFIKI